MQTSVCCRHLLAATGSLTSVVSSTASAPSLVSVGALSQVATRGFAFIVDVKDNNVEEALKALRKKTNDADLQQELMSRRFHLNGCQQRFEREKETYNRSQGKVISDRLKWVLRRRKAK